MSNNDSLAPCKFVTPVLAIQTRGLAGMRGGDVLVEIQQQKIHLL